MIMLALFSIHSICKSATIRGSVKEIHSGAGKASAANQVTVTLYRGVLGVSDLQKVETIRTDIDGLYHFENIPKGEYTIHVQDPNVKEPNWGLCQLKFYALPWTARHNRGQGVFRPHLGY